ncbi:hypothetical protein BC829DRAFT_287830 [Chytridium lagenaria]|nr:hypothetical protein BC829DRAFT_287830 [Chytridium lagenaria]
MVSTHSTSFVPTKMSMLLALALLPHAVFSQDSKLAFTVALTMNSNDNTMKFPGDNNYLWINWGASTCAPREYITDGCRNPDNNEKDTVLNAAERWRSFDTFVLRRNFPGEATFQDIPILNQAFLTPEFIWSGQTGEGNRIGKSPVVVLNATTPLADASLSLSSLPSDYYSIYMSGVDTLGREIKDRQTTLLSSKTACHHPH